MTLLLFLNSIILYASCSKEIYLKNNIVQSTNHKNLIVKSHYIDWLKRIFITVKNKISLIEYF